MTSVMRVGRVAAFPVDRRSLLYGAVAVLLLAVIAVATLTLGRLGIPLAELPSALLGGAEGSSAFVLERLRGPRLVTAVLVGALLGISGTLFQTVTRNPLGSPDVIGLGAGAGAGAALASLVFAGMPAAVGAVLGAGIATALVFVCTGRGFRSPTRTIIAGIAVAAIAYAVTQYVVSVKLRDAASQLAAYLVGSLNAASMQDVVVTGGALAVLLPAATALAPKTALLELGDDVAAGLGVATDRTRSTAVLLSVAAAGAAVAAAGPVSFIALTAPHITRRLTRAAHAGILPTALTGAVLMGAADLAAQQIPLFDGLPVGVLTLGVGGVYLGWLLVQERSRGRL
ncbi:iron chelate uptake ABC transporter family permease subunit [Microbacterium betulae]|uniref:Iron chelate uptake ABC transporter family permease subunit n=1 Tax=Microbacterium betulae TaxID=2981139 RepID=A0AA97I6B8_9MICO|nr:iron chelate uptake ABC transporter family permease subunit [Microbacterium sp. AB]WOF22457.1 iron chelate uptake ABC transporter family permease subunit [Microbacterium sp. AB]